MSTVYKSNYVQLTDHESRIAQNESDISTNASDISTNASAISTNASNISTNASNIATNTSDISSHSSTLSSHASTLSDHESRIGDLEAQSAVLYQKVVAIGDWDMDGTQSVNVAHGLTYADIRGARAILRNDGDTARYPIFQIDTGFVGAPDAGISQIDSTNVTIGRVTSGQFDSANFDSTSYNRGWVIIDYV